LVLATVVGYGGAAWGLYRATAWWSPGPATRSRAVLRPG
jgi:hypothetical protein